jgi:hypothetical protein
LSASIYSTWLYLLLLSSSYLTPCSLAWVPWFVCKHILNMTLSYSASFLVSDPLFFGMDSMVCLQAYKCWTNLHAYCKTNSSKHINVRQVDSLHLMWPLKRVRKILQPKGMSQNAHCACECRHYRNGFRVRNPKAKWDFQPVQPFDSAFKLTRAQHDWNSSAFSSVHSHLCHDKMVEMLDRKTTRLTWIIKLALSMQSKMTLNN